MFRLSVRPKIIIKNFVVFVLASFQDSLGMRLCTYGVEQQYPCSQTSWPRNTKAGRATYLLSLEHHQG